MAESDVNSSHPPQYVDLETIRLTRDGNWLSNGSEITHEETCRAFARHLEQDGEGYFIRIGRDFKRIEVEDTPYFVTAIRGTPEEGFQIFLNDQSSESLDPTTLTYQPGRLVCRIKQKRFEARFLHSSYFEVLQGAVQDEHGYFLIISNVPIRLS